MNWSSSLRGNWRAFPRHVRPFSLSQRRYRPRWFPTRSSPPPSERPFAEDLRYPPILKAFLFTVGVSGGVLCATAYATNRDTEKWSHALQKTSVWSIITGPPTNADLRSARTQQLLSRLRAGLDKGKQWFGDSANIVQKTTLYTYAMLAQKWLDSAEGRRISRLIIAVNGTIWLMWQIPRLRPMMTRHFLHHPLSGLSHTLLTSTFSHQNLLHLVFNSLALSGFGSTAFLYLTQSQERKPSHLPESTAAFHFLSFFISAGLFSSFLAHAVRVRFYYPRLVSQLSASDAVTATSAVTTTARTTSSTTITMAAKTAADTSKAAAIDTAVASPGILPSLGASGAIWACVSLTALAFPDAHMSLIIPSSFAIPIQTGTGALVLLDVIGIIRGWRYLDHWAHLGGAMFGALYYAYGPTIWERARLFVGPTLKQPSYNSEKK